MRPSQASHRLEKNPGFYGPSSQRTSPNCCQGGARLRTDTSHRCGNSIQPKAVESSVAPHTNRRHESRREDEDDDVVAAVAVLVAPSEIYSGDKRREGERRRRWTERIEKENIHQRHRCEWHSHSSHLKERRLLAPQLHHSAPPALSSYLLCLPPSPLGPKLKFLSGSDSRKIGECSTCSSWYSPSQLGYTQPTAALIRMFPQIVHGRTARLIAALITNHN